MHCAVPSTIDNWHYRAYRPANIVHCAVPSTIDNWHYTYLKINEDFLKSIQKLLRELELETEDFIFSGTYIDKYAIITYY